MIPATLKVNTKNIWDSKGNMKEFYIETQVPSIQPGDTIMYFPGTHIDITHDNIDAWKDRTEYCKIYRTIKTESPEKFIAICEKHDEEPDWYDV